MNTDNIEIGEVGDFDYYLLQLSYAPELCTDPDRKDARECSEDYNLILLGLWPQYYKPVMVDCKIYNGPQYCKSKYNVSQDYINENILPRLKNWDAIAPDYDSVAEERFLKHGACTGLNPFDYFALSFRLASSIPQYVINENTTLEQIQLWYPNGKIQTDYDGKLIAINFVFDKNVSFYHNVW